MAYDDSRRGSGRDRDGRDDRSGRERAERERDEYDAGRSYGGDGGYGAGPGNEYREDPREAWGRDRYGEFERGRDRMRGAPQQEWGGGYGGGYGRSGGYGERGGRGAWGGEDAGRGATYGAGGGAGWGTTGSVGGERQGSFAGRGPRNYRRTDARIEEDVNEALTRHPDLDATDIEVKVADGEVTLGGTVDSRQAKRLAEDVAESVSGVRDVANQIRVSRQDDDAHRAAEREVTRTASREAEPPAASGRTATSRSAAARDSSSSAGRTRPS